MRRCFSWRAALFPAKHTANGIEKDGDSTIEIEDLLPEKTRLKQRRD
jgi:hypothetical protein